MPEEIQLAEIETGVFAGEKISPIPSVGLYVPRGRGAFPSMMLMLAIPAWWQEWKEWSFALPPINRATSNRFLWWRRAWLESQKFIS